MKIQLDHVQRVNLHSLLGAQRGDVATIRARWAIQDELALSPDEEMVVELRREFVCGQERVAWNNAVLIPPRAFDFTEAETKRIKAALD